MKKYFILILLSFVASGYALDNISEFEGCTNYIKQGNYEQAVPCFEKYIKKYGEFDNLYTNAKDGLFFAYYGYAGDFLKKDKNDPNSALFYYQEAYNIASDSEKRKLADGMITFVKGFLEYKKTTPTTTNNDSQNNSTNSDGDLLASFGIVKKQDNEEAYNLKSNVLRQEVIGMAIKLGKFELPDNYVCKGMFKDVSSTKPNNWICRVVEIGAANGIVSKLNRYFNPQAGITKAEALAILMKAAGIKIDESNVNSKYIDVTVPWQLSLVNTALSYNFIDEADMFYPNNKATRGEIFNMARRILQTTK